MTTPRSAPRSGAGPAPEEGAVGAFARATGRGLESDGDKPRYLRYQHELIDRHLGRGVVEVGAGTGEFAASLRGRERLIATDVDPGAVEVIARRFADRPEVEARTYDLAAAAAAVAAAGEPEDPTGGRPVDSVVAVNVLEHIEDDVSALRALAGLVVPGGTVVVWVPGYQQLYGEFDRLVGHVRRYTPKTLRAAAGAAGLRVEVCRPVNLLGGLAWWLAVRRGGAGSPDPRLVRLYDRAVVPVTRAVERVVPAPFGQSVLCAARRP